MLLATLLDCMLHRVSKTPESVQSTRSHYSVFFTLSTIAAWICLFFFMFRLLCKRFTVLYPGDWTRSTFITTHIGMPIFFFWTLWVGHKPFVARNGGFIHPQKRIYSMICVTWKKVNEYWKEIMSLTRPSRTLAKGCRNVLRSSWDR
jgi:amino acid permease